MRREYRATIIRGRSFVLVRTLWSLVLGTCLLANCASLPSQSKVKVFGQAVGSAADTLTKATDLNSDLAQHEGEDRDAAKYLAGSTYDLPPKDTLKLPEQALKPRLELITAIGKYGASLSTAADQGTVQDVQASATALASTFGQDISPVLGAAAVPIISPAAKLVGWGIGLAVANAEAVEIQEVMHRTHPVLQRAADELKASFAIIVGNDNTHLTDWKVQKRILLDKLKNSGDPGAALAEF